MGTCVSAEYLDVDEEASILTDKVFFVAMGVYGRWNMFVAC